MNNARDIHVDNADAASTYSDTDASPAHSLQSVLSFASTNATTGPSELQELATRVAFLTARLGGHLEDDTANALLAGAGHRLDAAKREREIQIANLHDEFEVARRGIAYGNDRTLVPHYELQLRNSNARFQQVRRNFQNYQRDVTTELMQSLIAHYEGLLAAREQ